ncbi:MAG: UvrD-helicase domain-containing protein [Bdellovibrionota bacterium]
MSRDPLGENMMLRESTLVRAGAGAGKTTALIQRFIDYSLAFKKANGRWPHIVLTTFTKKATHEIKERLYQKALENNDRELFDFINSPSLVQITTIHGLLSSFLGENGMEMGLRPHLTIGDQRLLDAEKRNLLRKMLIEKPEWSQILEVWRFGELLHILEDWATQQTQYASFTPWPLKEMQREVKTLLTRHARVLQSCFRQIQEVCTLPSWQSWCAIFPKDLEDTWEGTYPRLKKWLDTKGRKPSFLKAKPPFDVLLRDRMESALEELEDLMKLRVLESDIQQKMEEIQNIFDPLAQEFAQRYFKLRLEKGLLSFDDLEIFSLRMIKDHPESVDHFSQRWDYWLVDEYQDTSPLQEKLLKAMIGNSPHYVVGDPQQSIYLFRGARAEVFDSKAAQFKENNHLIINQMINYRSRKEILDFINGYFSFYSDRFSAMEVGSKESNPADPAVDIIPMAEDEEEILKAKDYLIHLLEKGVTPETICVLSGTHLMLSSLGDELIRAKIDFQIHSHGKFFERDEVIDALTILKFLSNPHDNRNFVGILRAPWFHMPENKIQTFCRGGSYWVNSLKSEWSKETVIQELQKYLSLMKERGVIDTFRKILLEKGLFQSAGNLDSTGQREANLWKVILHLGTAEKKPGFSLTEYLRRIEENETLVEGEIEGDAAPFIEPKKVQMMTIHASKGLQFENVILLGYGKDQRKSHHGIWAHKDGNYSLSLRDEETGDMIPSWLAYKVRKEINHREEEEYMRLLYVAFTRAKNKIAFFPSAKPRKSSWQTGFPGSWVTLNEKSEQPIVNVIMDLPKKEYWVEGLGELATLAPVHAYRPDVGENPLTSESVTAQLDKEAKIQDWSAEVFKKIQKGVDFHRFVEFLKYENESITAQNEVADPTFFKALNFVKDHKDVPMLDLIREGFVEWGFTVKRGTKKTTGQIDLWGWYKDKLWVVDYKTGKSGAATEKAFEQVKMYAEALQQIFPKYQGKPVELVIVYPFEEKIVRRPLEVG